MPDKFSNLTKMVLPNPMIYGKFKRDGNPNIFDGGGWLGFASSLAPGITSIIDGANTDTSNIDDAVNADIKTLRNSWSGVDNSSLDSLMNQQASLRNLDTDYNAADKFNVPTSGSIWRDSLTNAASSAASTLSLGPWAAAGSFLFNLGSGLFGGFNKQKKIQRAVDNADAKYAAAVNKENAYRQNSIRNAMENKVANNDRMLFSQVAAYGGPLGISLLPVDSAIDFMQNEELLSSLGEDKTKNNNRRTSMPMLAFGGALGGYGGDWSDGLNFIKAGGKHGENPLGGVPMGVAQDGQPNLVEEGEVIWNDYVFSNRIKMPKKLVEKYKLKGDPTFAVGVEQIQKNMSERPNDPIEKRGLDAALAEFMGEQEMIRQRKAEKEYQRELEESAAYAADGGPIHIAKNKKGTFTAAAKKHGMGVQEFASKVLANKEDYSPTMVKKANFARNASKWHHALGGHLFPNGGHYDTVTGEWIPDGIDFQNIMNSDFNAIRVPGNPWNVNPLDSSRAQAIRSLGTPNISNSGLEYWWNTEGSALKPQDKSILDLSKEVKPVTPLKNNSKTNGSNWETWLRYIPILGNSIGLATSWASKPDYSYADELDTLATNLANEATRKRVAPTYIGNYMAYNPFDRLFYANELGAQQAATNRAIMNQSNGNRGTAMAGLLASGYNSNVGLGKLFREGEEYNLAQRQKVNEFNRATDMFNAEADLKTQLANAEADRYRANILLNAKTTGLGWKQAADQARREAIWANASNLFQGLGDVGWEAVNRNMIVTNPALYYSIDRNGNISYKGLENLSERDQDYIKLSAEEERRKQGFACGGYLTIKNRRRK